MHPDLKWLVDPEVFAVGRLPAHSDHRWYQNEQELALGRMALRQSLDGEWQFAYSPCPAARPADFWQEDFDRSAFGPIQVPGHVELQGHGQIQYINTMYPWDGRSNLRPPQLDWDNAPLGSGELVKLAAQELGWKKSTTYTVLKKLCERGLFRNEVVLLFFQR